MPRRPVYPGDTAGNWVFLDEDAPSWLPAMLQEALTGQTQAAQITALGGNPAEFAQGLAGATVSVEKLEEDTIDYTAIIVVGIGVMVMITGILMFGGAVAQSVIEEKSSRVIEIMLSSVRPMHLLIGKILGAAVAGLVMLTALLLSAAAALIATGLARDLDIPWASLGLVRALLLARILLLRGALRHCWIYGEPDGGLHRCSNPGADAIAHHHLCAGIWLVESGEHLHAGYGVGAANLGYRSSTAVCQRQFLTTAAPFVHAGDRSGYRSGRCPGRANLPAQCPTHGCSDELEAGTHGNH